MQFIKKEVLRYMRKPTFYFSMGIILLCFVFEHRDYISFLLSKEGAYFRLDVFYLFVTPFDYSLFFYLVPLAAIPPAALTLMSDIKSQNINLRLYRTSRRKYCVEKLLSVSIGSMLPTFFACIIFLIFSLLIGPLDCPESLANRQTAIGKTMEFLALPFYGLPYIFEITIRASLSACCFGLLGGMIALLTMRSMDTLIIGFLSFWGLNCIFYYVGLSEWQPFALFFSNMHYTGSLLFRYVQNFIVIGVLFCLDSVLLSHKLKHL